jgi:hypothetical protein
VSIIKKISVFSFVMMVSAAGAMNRNYERYEKRNELISFKSVKGFPLISLDAGEKWAAQLSEKELQEVRKQIKWQKDKRLTTLFRVITLPQDVKRLIAAHIFEDEKKITNLSYSNVFSEYANAADTFCTMPLCDVLNQYASSIQTLKVKGKFNQLLALDTHFKPHIVFEYAQDINVFRTVVYNRGCRLVYSRGSNSGVDKKELQCIGKVADKFKDSVGKIDYELPYDFYEKWTVDNFKQQFNRQQLMLFSALVVLYINVNFPTMFDKALNKDKVEFNELAERFNNESRRLCGKTANPLICKSPVAMIDSYDPVFNQFAVIKLLSYVPLILAYGSVNPVPGFFRLKHYLEDDFLRRPYARPLSMIVLLCGYLLTRFTHSQSGTDLLCGLSSMIGVYALMCCSYNALKIISWRQGTVPFNKLSALLKRADIVIK